MSPREAAYVERARVPQRDVDLERDAIPERDSLTVREFDPECESRVACVPVVEGESAAERDSPGFECQSK
jgi:hypothetical protein